MLFTNLSSLPWVAASFIILSLLAVFTYFRKENLLKRLLSPSIYQKLRQSFIPAARPFKLVLLITALAALALALLDPRSRALSTDMRLQGIDLVLVYDVSRSMDVKDTAPSRLEAAKALGEKLADGLAGNRIGLVAFAADAYRLLPLTTDIEAVKLFLGDLNSGMIGSQSTDIGKALEAAAQTFAEDTLTHKALILFTDGENLDGDPGRAVDSLKKQGVNLFVVGMGTEAGGPVPIFDNGKERGYIRDLLGKEIISKARPSAMQALAKGADGAYFSAENAAQVTDRIDLLGKTSFGTKAQSFLDPQFRVFALIAMAALLLFLFLPERKILSALIFLSLSLPLHALTPERRAYESYNNQEFPSALRYYQQDLVKKPKKEKSKFGESASLYKMERSERSEAGFLALTNSKNKKRSLSALYNAGNAQVQGGKLNEALNSYGEILKNLPPEEPLYKKAMNNYLYVLQQKEQQQQNQQQKPQNQEQQGQNQQQKPQGQQQEQNQQQGQEKQQQGQSQQDQTQSKPISPKEVENLLGVAQAEEKQNLKRQEGQKGRGFIMQDKY